MTIAPLWGKGGSILVTHRLLRRLVPTVTTLTVGLVLLTACATHFTGGGHLTGALNPKDRATIAITFNCTSPGPNTCAQATVSGHYRDPGTNGTFPFGVAMTFSGVALPSLLPGNSGPCMDSVLDYTSEDVQHNSGKGQVLVTACTNTQSKDPRDFVFLNVVSGPDNGYVNAGFLQDGEFRGY